MTWKIESSTTEKLGRFKITIDEVILPNGDETTFSFIDVAKGVCILPITNQGEVLCIKQYRHAVKSWQWELPAGMIDTADMSPMDVAKIELEEETGYLAEHWLDLGSFYPSQGSTTEEVYLFAATGLIPSEQKLDTSEQIEVHTLSMEELKTLIQKGEFKDGAGLAAVLRYKFMTD